MVLRGEQGIVVMPVTSSLRLCRQARAVPASKEGKCHHFANCHHTASSSVTEVLTRVSSSRLPNEVRTGPAEPGAPPDAAARTCAFEVYLLQTRLCGALTGAVPRSWQVFLSCCCGQDNATSGGASRRCGGGQGIGACQNVCRQAHRRALCKLGSCSGTKVGRSQGQAPVCTCG